MSFRLSNNSKSFIVSSSSNTVLDNDWSINGNNIYNTNSGNVGIGLSNPLYTLDVSGNIKTTNIIDISNYDGSENQVLCSTPTGILWKYISSITERFPVGNTLFVDSVYGNDSIASSNPFYYPFSTISQALAISQTLPVNLSGYLVIVNAGTYNESLTIPPNVSVTGTGAQAVIIQKLNVTSPTTLITCGQNCRIENFTARLTTSGNYEIIGIDFPSGTSINTKLRNSIWTVQSTNNGNANVIGVRSSGISDLSYNPANAIQRSTINVISSTTGLSRGILVNGANRFSVRDIVVYARGTGSDIVGAEVDNSLGVLEIKTSTIGGSNYDVNRSNGSMIIGSTDLLSNNANGNSFLPTQAPASLQYSITTDLGLDRRYYLIPGTGFIINEAKTNPYDVTNSFPIPFNQQSLVISISLAYTQILGVNESITFNIYKNDLTTPSMSLVLSHGENPSKYTTSQSVTFNGGDVIRCTLETTGNPSGAGGFSALVGYY